MTASRNREQLIAQAKKGTPGWLGYALLIVPLALVVILRWDVRDATLVVTVSWAIVMTVNAAVTNRRIDALVRALEQGGQLPGSSKR